MENNITTIKEFYLLPGDELHIFIKNITKAAHLYLGQAEIDRENIKNVQIDL